MIAEEHVACVLGEGLRDGEPDPFGSAGDEDSHGSAQSATRMAGKASSGRRIETEPRAPDVQSRHLLRPERVALQNRLGDRRIFLELLLPVAGGDVGLELHAQQMDLHQRQHPLQFEVAANLNDRVVEAASLVEKGRRTAVVLERQQPPIGLAHAVCVVGLANVPGGEVRHQPDQRLEHHETVAHLEPRHRAHISAAVARQREHALGGQTLERLAHRSAAHMVVAGEIRLDQPLARHVDASADASDDRIDDAVGRSHFCGRARVNSALS